MILENQDNVKGFSWGADALCARMNVLEAENATLCEEVQVLHGWDKKFAVRLHQLEK